MHTFVLTAFLFRFVASQSKYCDPALCPSGRTHIACGNDGNFASTCPDERMMVPLTSPDIKTILRHHNRLRNKIASGAEVGFNPASRMATMTWSSELAQLAALNVKQCTMKHDQCRATRQFKLAGQNLAYRATTDKAEPLDSYIEAVIVNWYNECQYARQSDIDNCCKSASGEVIGHFTQVVADRATKVGCAISRYTEDGWIFTLIACNYSFSNVQGLSVYTSGVAASNCTLGANPSYPALCHIKEPKAAFF